MLEPFLKQMLIDAASTGNIDEIDKAIQIAKFSSPKNFFKDDDDPDLKERIFFHAPYSSHWTGKTITTGMAKQYQKRVTGLT